MRARESTKVGVFLEGHDEIRACENASFSQSFGWQRFFLGLWSVKSRMLIRRDLVSEMSHLHGQIEEASKLKTDIDEALLASVRAIAREDEQITAMFETVTPEEIIQK